MWGGGGGWEEEAMSFKLALCLQDRSMSVCAFVAGQCKHLS